MNINLAKLVTAITTIVGMVALLALGSISETQGVSTITMVLGYILGNGVAALRGEPVQPVISARTPRERFAVQREQG